MSEIVNLLFGVTPDSYRQAQQQKADERALQYARLSPIEKASYSAGRGGYALGGVIGGALGGQDPELQRITRRQQIAGQLNPNDLTTFEQAMAALAPTDPQGAMMVRAELEKIQMGQAKLASENALTGQRKAETLAKLREKQALDPVQKLLETGRYTPASVADFRESGDPTVLTLVEKEVKGPSFGPEAEILSKAKYGKSFANLTAAEADVVSKELEKRGITKAEASSSKFILPGDKALADIPDFRRKVQATIEPQTKTIYSADQALQAIEDSLATNNFASYRTAQVQFARAIAGAGDLSQRELKAAGADPSLLGGTADYLSSLFTSTPTADTQNKIRKTLEAIRNVAANKATAEVNRQRNMALRSPGYNVDAVTEALTFPELAPRVAAPASGAPGGDLAAQAAAELERRRKAK